MALTLQRFDISLADRDYKLVVSETLTLKPANLHIHARRRDGATAPPRSTAQDALTRPLTVPTEPSSGDNGPLLVLYGSNTGTSEAFAQRIGADAAAQGNAVTVAPLERLRLRTARGVPLIVATASYEGRPPDKCDALRHMGRGPARPCAGRTTLRGVRVRQSAMGPHLAGEPQARRGRTGQVRRASLPFARRRRCRRRPVRRFRELVCWSLAVASRHRRTQTGCPGAARIDVEVRRGTRERVLKLDEMQRGTRPPQSRAGRHAPPRARSKRHIEIALPNGMTYRAGDYLAVLPSNPPETVRRALARFGLEPDTEVIVHGAPGVPSALPVDRPVMAEMLFGDYLELQQPATRGRFLRARRDHSLPAGAQGGRAAGTGGGLCRGDIGTAG